MDDHIMKDSSTYQLILQRGRIEGARDTLLRQGLVKFSQPADAATQSQIDGITDLEHLQALCERILSVSSWADLVAEA